MDIVYVLREGDENDEFRHSLRSLQNLPHSRVVIAGGCPNWVALDAVTHIQVPGHHNKFLSSTANLQAALDSDVSDPFLLMNDDFFIMRPMDSVPVMHWGTVQSVIDGFIAQGKIGPYVNGMAQTRDLLLSLGYSDPLSYELHMPLLVHKRYMRKALSLRGNITAFHKRTVYGNLAQLGGTEATHDVKVFRSTQSEWKEWPLLSTSDEVFRITRAGHYIRQLFSTRSPYEKVPLSERRGTVYSRDHTHGLQVSA